MERAAIRGPLSSAQACVPETRVTLCQRDPVIAWSPDRTAQCRFANCPELAHAHGGADGVDGAQVESGTCRSDEAAARLSAYVRDRSRHKMALCEAPSFTGMLYMPSTTAAPPQSIPVGLGAAAHA
jgi:hypothetical protein